MLRRIFQAIVKRLRKAPSMIFPLTPPLPLPNGISELELFEYVTSIRVQDAPEAEMRAYGTHDFRRFVYTLGLAKELKGNCLELGSNPYFTTMLLKNFTELNISIANYFGNVENGEYSQKVDYLDLKNKTNKTEILSYQHFNVETDKFPYDNEQFELVIFSEIIEHLLNDPSKVLREIKRVLKKNGQLILTTPNVARLENISRLISGANIYDPYSGYGPYGRHNREYNRHELVNLLQFEGFDVIDHFTADVHENISQNYCSVQDLEPLIKFRSSDLGQYIFLKATVNSEKIAETRPSWLYRSYPEGSLS